MVKGSSRGEKGAISDARGGSGGGSLAFGARRRHSPPRKASDASAATSVASVASHPSGPVPRRAPSVVRDDDEISEYSSDEEEPGAPPRRVVHVDASGARRSIETPEAIAALSPPRKRRSSLATDADAGAGAHAPNASASAALPALPSFVPASDIQPDIVIAPPSIRPSGVPVPTPKSEPLHQHVSEGTAGHVGGDHAKKVSTKPRHERGSGGLPHFSPSSTPAGASPVREGTDEELSGGGSSNKRRSINDVLGKRKGRADVPANGTSSSVAATTISNSSGSGSASGSGGGSVGSGDCVGGDAAAVAAASAPAKSQEATLPKGQKPLSAFFAKRKRP